MEKEKATIPIRLRPSTRAALASAKADGETYDDLIRKMYVRHPSFSISQREALARSWLIQMEAES